MALLRQASDRSPSVSVVEGEAGVGKTRLVRELVTVIERRRIFIGACHELAEPFPFGPLFEAVREAPLPASLPAIVGALRPFLPELADRLPAALPSVHDQRAEKHRVFRALRAFFEAFDRSVLVLEDLQWADQPTLEFLQFLAPEMPPGLALVCTYQREPGGESPIARALTRLDRETFLERLVLQPLDQAGVRQLVGAILDVGKISQAFGDYLLERTAGLPLAVEEVLLLLQEQHELIRREGEWVRAELYSLGVPDGIRDTIARRVGALDEEARRVLWAAGVLGVDSAETLVAEVAELDEEAATDALTRALASSLLVARGCDLYRLRHSLARQAVEEMIPAPLLRRMHLRAAGALERTDEHAFARIARHYRFAGVTDKWIHFAEAAAERAVSWDDHATAFALLRDAVALSELDPETRARVAVKLLRHGRTKSARQEAAAIARRLIDEDLLDSRTRGQLRARLGWTLDRLGDWRAGYEEVLRALHDLEGDEAARAMGWLAFAPSRASRSERLTWLDRAQELSRCSEDGALEIETSANRAACLIALGDPKGLAAIDEIPQPTAVPREAAEAVRGYANVADWLLHVGYYELACSINDRAIELATSGAPAYILEPESTRLQLDWLTGRWDGLEARLRGSLDDRADQPQITQGLSTVLALLLLAQGRVKDARVALETLAKEHPGIELRMKTWIAGGLARAALIEGRAQRAAEHALHGISLVEETAGWLTSSELIPVTTEALLAAQRPNEATDLVALFKRELTSREAPAATAALATCKALLTEHRAGARRAAKPFLQAAEKWRELPRPFEATRQQAHAARCLLSCGQEGQGLMDDAVELFRELGARRDLEEARRTLQRHGLTPPRRRGRHSYGNQLSPREAEIAKLAAQGLSNREIGVMLVLSVKTVEGHLHSVMRKLDVSSRKQLVGREIEF